MSSACTDIAAACTYYENRKQYQKDYYRKLKNGKVEADHLSSRIKDLENIIAAKEVNIKELDFIKNNLNIELHRNMLVYKDLKNLNEKLTSELNELKSRYKHLKAEHDKYLTGTQLLVEFFNMYPNEYRNLIRKLKTQEIVDENLRNFVQSQQI
jgi:chromosome segregation ATPase